MNLKTALGVQPGELVALIGAGGKTTIAWQLLGQLGSLGERAVFATTTHIFQPMDLPLILNPNPAPKAIADVLAESKALVLAAGRGEKGDPAHAAHSPYSADFVKLRGLEPEVLNELARQLPNRLSGVTWLVEADGARGRMLKAPAEYEPVIPSKTDRVIVVAGMGAIGQLLDEGAVHRPEIAADLLDVPIGETVTPELFAELVGHPEGGLKGIPDSAEVVVLLTQWEDRPHIHTDADTIAGQLLSSNRINRVVLVNLRAPDPVVEVWE